MLHIVSSNKVETARYNDLAPSDGMYELSDVRTIISRVAGGIVASAFSASACRASAAMAIFSSVVNATNGRTAVTRESKDGCNIQSEPDIPSVLAFSMAVENTHTKPVRHSWAEETHKVDVLLPRQLRFLHWALLLVLEYKIMSNVRCTQPDHL